MDRRTILSWLRQNDPRRLNELWTVADETRRREVGDQVHLRGLIEFSNYCARQCAYCGLQAPHVGVERYRLTKSEILTCVQQIVDLGYGTVVLQSGEDPGTKREWLADVIRNIKSNTPLAVTLSAGERCDDDFAAWREAGADRYLLRFETSNLELFQRIHPPLTGTGKSCAGSETEHPRVAILRRLRKMGYEVGSGVMIGIPGQTFEDLADDIELFGSLELDMIGCGPFIPHPATPLGARSDSPACAHSAPTRDQRPDDQVPADELMTYKVIALARLVCPRANIPATTALATLNRSEGRTLGLQRGANVVMPNVTPARYRAAYDIYPDKACVVETAEACRERLAVQLAALGRTVGCGRGDSRSHALRTQALRG